MNGSPPFANVKDEGQLPGPSTRRKMADNKDDRLQQGQPKRPTNKDQGQRSIHNNQHYVGMIFFNLVLFAVAITLHVCCLFDCCVPFLPCCPPSLLSLVLVLILPRVRCCQHPASMFSSSLLSVVVVVWCGPRL